MAGRKRPRPWDATFRRIRVHYWPPNNYPPRTSAEELDAAEKELNFRFPDSYRTFAEEFGLGGELVCSLPKVLPLTRPNWARKKDWSKSVFDATRFFHTHDWSERSWDENVAPSTFLRRVIVFALDGGYAEWVFDPLEMTDARSHEYRIYDIDRTRNAVAVASSFAEWIQLIDRDYRFPDEDESEEEEPEFQYVYLPSAPEMDSIIYRRDIREFRRKRGPAKKAVKGWLAWNDSTARTLAETIRHHQRPDLFPILADALEDAGCTSVDVLRSCRTGDPAVDGVWVLQVLLGKPTTR